MAKRVVIIGGGFAGSTIAKLLSQNKSLDITLIDTKEYFEHTPSVLREVVAYKEGANPEANGAGSGITSSFTLPHSSYLSGKLVIGEVVEVSEKCVHVRSLSRRSSSLSLRSPPTSPASLNRTNTPNAAIPKVPLTKEEEDQLVEYDYLAICTGNLYPGFVKAQEEKLVDRDTNLMREFKSLRTAKRILVVGGGPAGVELAGDILHYYPSKEVTLVHSRPVILDRAHPKAQYVAQQSLEAYSRIILHQRIVALQVNEDQISVRKSSKKSPFLLLNDSNRTFSHSMILRSVEREATIQYVTNEGIRGYVDKVFFCCGASSSANFMHKHFASQLDDEYRLRVNNFLQLENYPHIFAAGDITFFKEEKLADRAVRQAEVVAENISRLAKGLPAKAQYFAQPKPGAQVITAGPLQGIFMMWGSVICCGEATHHMKNAFLAHHIKRIMVRHFFFGKTCLAKSVN
jgi:NADH dehydrogenase FAD-containing subunit